LSPHFIQAAIALATPTLVMFGIAANLFVFMIFVAIWASRYRRVGPDEVLIVSGRRYVLRDAEGKTQVAGWKMVKGGGVFVWPIYETAQALSLKPVSLDMAFKRIPIAGGPNAEVNAKALVRIMNDDLSVARAAQSLLGKTPEQLSEIAIGVLESTLRKLLGSTTASDLSWKQGQLAAEWQDSASKDLADLGLGIVSLSVQQVKAEGRS
jgi:flotillin